MSQRHNVSQCHTLTTRPIRAEQGTVLYDSLGRIISEAYFSSKTDEQIQRLVLAAAFGRPELETGHLPPVTTVNYGRFLDVSRKTGAEWDLMARMWRMSVSGSIVYMIGCHDNIML